MFRRELVLAQFDGADLLIDLACNRRELIRDEPLALVWGGMNLVSVADHFIETIVKAPLIDGFREATYLLVLSLDYVKSEGVSLHPTGEPLDLVEHDPAAARKAAELVREEGWTREKRLVDGLVQEVDSMRVRQDFLDPGALASPPRSEQEEGLGG